MDENANESTNESTGQNAGAERRSSLSSPGNAVWYFVGATFAFSWGGMMMSGDSKGFGITLLVVGAVVLAAGIWEWTRPKPVPSAQSTQPEQPTQPSQPGQNPPAAPRPETPPAPRI